MDQALVQQPSRSRGFKPPSGRPKHLSDHAPNASWHAAQTQPASSSGWFADALAKCTGTSCPNPQPAQNPPSAPYARLDSWATGKAGMTHGDGQGDKQGGRKRKSVNRKRKSVNRKRKSVNRKRNSRRRTGRKH